MPNPDTPRGLKPVRYLSGGHYDGATNKYFVPASDATAIFMGGLVKLAGDADADGVPAVTGDVATGDAVVGVVTNVMPVTSNSTTYREASTGRYVYVADNPNLLFEVQDDGASAVAATSVGAVADLTGFTAGNTVTGMSEVEVSTAAITGAGDGTEDVLLWGVAQSPDNTIDANCNWLVRLNNHALVDGNVGA